MARPVEPRPLKRSTCGTIFLRVPGSVWPLVSTGAISEFRAAAGNAPQLWHVPLPTLVVAYRRRLSRREYDVRLMLLEDVRQEALGAITLDGLRKAGYEGEDAFARYRRDWIINEKRKFSPLRRVFVYTVRLVRAGDVELAGAGLVEHLYGSFVGLAERPRTITLNAT